MRFALVLLVACAAKPSEPPHARDITAWAAAHAMTLSAPSACNGVEEQYFGARSATCWSATSTVEQTPGSRMFPRVVIAIAQYRDERAAQDRMVHFHEVPHALSGEAGKTYPLRAGFRLGTRVVMVTTDAYAFERDAYRAAATLSTALGGTELTCWQRC